MATIRGTVTAQNGSKTGVCPDATVWYSYRLPSAPDEHKGIAVDANLSGNYYITLPVLPSEIVEGSDTLFASVVEGNHISDVVGEPGGLEWTGDDQEKVIDLVIKVSGTTPDTDEESEPEPDVTTPSNNDSLSKLQETTRDSYYSGTNCSVSIRPANGTDNKSLDIVTINFTVQSEKLPLYGYNSLYFDDVAIGSLLVQGSFTLNVQHAAELNRELKAAYGKATPLYGMGGTRYRFLGAGQGWENARKDGGLVSQGIIPASRFDLNIVYKIDFSKDYVSTGYLIRDAQISSVGQAVAAGGEPLGENYTFLARSIEPRRYLPNFNQGGSLYE